MNSKLITLFITFYIMTCVQCFKSGVTRQSCRSMRPEHKRPNTEWEYAPQFTNEPPFEIKVNTTKVKPGELVEVVLTSKGQYDFFKGYFMQVFEDKSFFSTIIPFPQGSWIPLGRSRTLKCHIYEDSISHTEASYKRNVTMLWKAPQAITHPFKVKATVVRNFTHYWEDIYSPTIYATDVIAIVTPPVTTTNTVSPVDAEKEKQLLLETLAKEVGADSAKELLEILKQKVIEKNNSVVTVVTAAPTKTADQKIEDMANKNPDTAQQIKTVAKNPGILDKVKGLIGLGGKSDSGGGGGLLSGLLGGGSGLMGMLPMLMPMMGGGGPLSALMGGGSKSNPLSMITSMMGGGGGAGGLMSSLLGGSKPKPPSSPLAALMGGGGGGSSNPLASLMGGGGGSNPLASLMGGGGGGANPLASLMGGGAGGGNPLAGLMGGGGGGGNPLAGLMGGAGGGAPNPLGALMGGQGGQTNPMAGLMGPQQPGGGDPLSSLMSNPAITSMLKGITGGGGARPPPSAGLGGQNLADLLGVDPNAGTPRAELAENTSGTKASPLNTNAFPQMIGNIQNQNRAGSFGNGMQNGFPGMQGNGMSMNGMATNGMSMNGMPGNRMPINGMPGQFQGMNGQIRPTQQGMPGGQFMGQNGQNQFRQTQMTGQQNQMGTMQGTFGGFPQGPPGFQQQNTMMGQVNHGNFQQQTQMQQNQQLQQNQQSQSTMIDMNKIQTMMNGPNGDVIKNAMQDMLAGRKTAADVMAIVNSHPAQGNGMSSNMNGLNNGGQNGMINNMGGMNNGVSNGMNNNMGGSNNAGQNGLNNMGGLTNGGQNGFSNGMTGNPGQNSFNMGMPNNAGQNAFNMGMTNSGGHNQPNNGLSNPTSSNGFNNGMTNSGTMGFNGMPSSVGQGGFNSGVNMQGGTGFNQGQNVHNQGFEQTNNNLNMLSTNTHSGLNPITSHNTGPDPNINPPPDDKHIDTGSNGFINMPDFSSMLGGPPSASNKGSLTGAGGLPDLSSLLGGSGGGASPDLSSMLDKVDLSQVSGMMGGMKADDIKGMLSGPQGADLMSAASALMSGGKVDDKNPLAGLLNGPQGAQLQSMAQGLLSGSGGDLSSLLSGAGGGGGLGGIMSMFG